MFATKEILLLVTCLCTIAAAIRVDWNTNKGPIVPPTPRTTVRPQPPYREPAPVWEDLSNDIPNPNPYVYILPPPSRPRDPSVTYKNSNDYNYINRNYGGIIAPNQVNSYFQAGNTKHVAALSPKYMSNVGFKYSAVVPKIAAPDHSYGTTTSRYYFGDVNGKVQGKYNAKTKKYKAYEKSKYTPLNYYPLFDLEDYVPEFDPEQLIVRQQQLPLLETASAFSPVELTSTTQKYITTSDKSIQYDLKQSTPQTTKYPTKKNSKKERKDTVHSPNSIFNTNSIS